MSDPEKVIADALNYFELVEGAGEVLAPAVLEALREAGYGVFPVGES